MFFSAKAFYIFVIHKYLRALGYEDTEIQPVLKKLSIEYKDVSPLVSAALREFGKQ